MSFSQGRRFDAIQIFATIRESVSHGRAPRHSAPVDPWAAGDPLHASAFAYVQIEVPA